MNSMALMFGAFRSSCDSMLNDNRKTRQAVRSDGRAGGVADGPEWSKGLKQLYDSVVEEPLPDTFKDLLAQLNKGA